MNRTYETHDENAMPTPRWLGVLRALVFGLLFVSIIAMATVAWAAVRLVNQALSPPQMPNEIDLPDNTTPISVTDLRDGRYLIIVQDQTYQALIYDGDGEWIETLEFK